MSLWHSLQHWDKNENQKQYKPTLFSSLVIFDLWILCYFFQDIPKAQKFQDLKYLCLLLEQHKINIVQGESDSGDQNKMDLRLPSL